ncbi:MAG TPA: sulfotransferase family 2 domain-containing protein [Anaerolineales bacterium]|nr:sulfotransferase family 2 domain-containing protein [Anaerolineales bacterium]
MIISHKNRYLFVEIPQTASVAISHELRENYDGEQILEKHSFYSDFLKIASPEEKKYFVFAGIRNPLDDIVTLYFKYKTDYGQEFTDPSKRKKIKLLRKLVGTRMFEEVHGEGMDFKTFFMKYYKGPYNNFSCLIRDRYDFLIRFEHLQEDFARLLQLLGLEQKRPLPVRNSTKEKNKDFWSYYSPDMIPRAKRVVGPFMKQWGYEFPPEWGAYSLTRWDQIAYDWFTNLRKIKWNYLRFL